MPLQWDGGFASGLANAGFAVRWASDLDEFACATFRHRLPEVRLIEKDVCDLSTESDRLTEVDVLTRRPEREEEAVRQIKNHFFARDSRALIRDNGVSRLWWLGKIAHEVSPDDPREFLKILLHRQDVRSALIERPAVSMNRRVLQAIFVVMREHWVNGGKLFKRETFRSWMVALNRRGGVVLLDALPQSALDRLLREEAANAIAENQ